jgi:trehalose 6-phosphate phosphatase
VHAGSTNRAVRPDWGPWALGRAKAGVVTDFDGTLAPIVEDPAHARPLPGVPEVLAKLSGSLGLVAVVSGRPVDYLASHLQGNPRLLLVGLYGLEREQGGRRVTSDRALEWASTIASEADAAEQAAPSGVKIERKGLSFSLHARQQVAALPWLLAWAARCASVTGLRAQPGRLSVELLPPVDIDKGAVVDELAEGLDAICFLGDDRGDLPGFEALRRQRQAGKHVVTVGVESREQPRQLARAVDYLVDGPEGALELLLDLARALAST